MSFYFVPHRQFALPPAGKIAGEPGKDHGGRGVAGERI